MSSPLVQRRRVPGTYLFLLVAFAAGVLVDRGGMLPGSPPVSTTTFEPFWETWRLVEAHYVDRSAVKSVPMTRGAIRGMLASLGDEGHTTYLSPEQFANLQKELKGQLYGIGVRLSLRKGRLIIVNTFPDSPARKAGLKPGDVLVSVNGADVRGMPLQKIVAQVRGEPGSEVRLNILRKGHTLEVQVRRGEVHVPTVNWRLLPGTSIAHLAIEEFGKDTDAQLRAALRDAQSKGVKALVVDVRGNPGGLKDQAVAVTSEFLTAGNVFLEQDADGKRTPVPVKSGGAAASIPVCLLIDEGTASSAEIFAGALQDHKRAKLVGTKTFGTGTVLQPFGLRDRSVVLLAISEWLTPNGRQIWHHGIVPDIEVTLPEDVTAVLPETETEWTPEDLKKTKDKQLAKGVEVVGSK